MKIRLLLADNKAAHLKLFSEVLVDAGFLVTEASSFAAARNLLERENFDVAIVDLHLKRQDDDDMSGIQLAERFRDKVPFVILTGSPTVKAARRALETDGDKQTAVAFVEKADGPDALLRAVRKAFIPAIFIAHGHNDYIRGAVSEFLDSQKMHSVVLQEEPGGAQSILEKFESYSNVHLAIILLTADDLGSKKVEVPILRPRARQNVIFELGFFVGKLGRDHVIALYKEDGDRIELPSDYEGICYIEVESNGHWRSKLGAEIKRGLSKLYTQ